VDRETPVVRRRVQDADTAIMKEQEDVGNAEKERSTTRTPEKMSQEMFHAIGASLNNLASSDDEVDGNDEEDEEEDTGRGMLSEDDKPS